MKRRILCVFLCCLIVLGNIASNAFAEAPEARNVDWGLTLTADEVTPVGMVLVISQSGGNYAGDLEYGAPFQLEYYADGEWKPVSYISDTVYWPMIAYIVRENTATRLDISWESIYGKLPEGHYRLVKEFCDFVDGGEHNEADFYAEFVISGSQTSQSNDSSVLAEEDVYRVVGNADWMGSWDEANELGIMSKVKDGVYRKVFENVPPGSYELKITKNGKWDGAYGVDGRNYMFSVHRTNTITVDFYLRDGIGVIDVYGYMVGWDDDEEDQEENPKASDGGDQLPALLLLMSVGTLAFLLYKKKEMI